MFDSKKQNPLCNFNEEVVSYLYNEMNDSVKAEFEDHLADCSSCPDELAAFTSVRSTIQDWRELEFNSLKTPSIEIPYERNVNVRDAVIVRKPASWVERFTAAISLSPSFLRTAAAFGVVAITLGLGWFLISSILDKDINTAGKRSDSTLNQENSVIKSQSPDGIAKIIDESNSASDNLAKPEEKRVNAPFKVKYRSPKKNNHSKRLRVKRKRYRSPKRPDQMIITEMPRLTEVLAVEMSDETEIRLTDLFDEIGSDK